MITKKNNKAWVLIGVLALILLTIAACVIDNRPSDNGADICETTAESECSDYVTMEHFSCENKNDGILITNPVTESAETTATSEVTTVTSVITQATTSCETTSQTQNVKLTPLEVPQIDTSFKSYMSYKVLNRVGTPQCNMQQRARTDEKGLRKVGDDYCVALGSFYAKKCGERFKITLDSGNSFTCITGDGKADRHTDSTNRYNVLSGNRGCLVEFIVDVGALLGKVRSSGNIGTYAEFSGNVIKIERLG